MNSITEEDVLKHASTTFYYSSRFFPAKTRRDLLKLYGFIRIARDYVNLVPVRPDHVSELEALWQQIRDNPAAAQDFRNLEDPNELVMRDMADLHAKYNFDPSWTDSFIASLHMDLYNRNYQTLDDTLQYMYGSSEVVGLCVAKILHLHPDAYHFAQMQARAMQYINFIRDLADDASFGRERFPQEELRTFGLKDLTANTTYKYPVAFKDFIALQLGRYKEWQQTANQGFRFIRRRDRVPIRTAIDMYEQIAAQIEANPFIVYESKLRPGKWQVYRQGVFRAYYG